MTFHAPPRDQHRKMNCKSLSLTPFVQPCACRKKYNKREGKKNHQSSKNYRQASPLLPDFVDIFFSLFGLVSTAFHWYCFCLVFFCLPFVGSEIIGEEACKEKVTGKLVFCSSVLAAIIHFSLSYHQHIKHVYAEKKTKKRRRRRWRMGGGYEEEEVKNRRKIWRGIRMRRCMWERGGELGEVRRWRGRSKEEFEGRVWRQWNSRASLSTIDQLI